MTSTVTEILEEIDFEIAQGAVSRNDLGQAVQAVRQYHNQLRGQLLPVNGPPVEVRELASRQLQFNDMLITLSQELAAGLRALERQVRQRPARTAEPEAADAITAGPAPAVPAGAFGLPEDELEALMRPEAIRVELATAPSHLPVVGGLITRLKEFFFHLPPLYYVQRYAERQAPVNRVYGESLLALAQEVRDQRAQIAHLSAQVAALQQQLAQTGGAAPH